MSIRRVILNLENDNGLWEKSVSDTLKNIDNLT